MDWRTENVWTLVLTVLGMGVLAMADCSPAWALFLLLNLNGPASSRKQDGLQLPALGAKEDK